MIPRYCTMLLFIASNVGCGNATNESKMSEKDLTHILACFENCVAGSMGGLDPTSEQLVSGNLSVELCRSSTTQFCLKSMLLDGVLVENVARNHRVGNYFTIDVRSMESEVSINLYNMPFFVGFSIAFDEKEEFFYQVDSRAKIDRLVNRLKKDLKETALGEK
jgi:hypothetical protein